MTVSLNGTVEADRTPWAGLFPMNAATPITDVHLGIEYRGEVVRAARWSASLGHAPGDGAHFKIVLFQDGPKLDLPKIAVPNIAVCVPPSRDAAESAPGPGRDLTVEGRRRELRTDAVCPELCRRVEVPVEDSRLLPSLAGRGPLTSAGASA